MLQVKVSRVGVVGLGGIGRVHISGWRELGAELHGFDELPESRAVAQEDLGLQVHPDLASLLRSVDVVDVCTPTDTHAALALAALRAGKPVICEKPLARTLEEADELISASEQAGVPLFTAQVVRFMPEYASAQAAVAAGRIGRPAVMRFTREGGMPNPQGWYHDTARSAGIIGDVMIHDIDFARWLAGDVVRVYAKLMRPAGPQNGPTHAYAILTHVGGTISHLTASWARQGGSFRTSYELAGSDGMIDYASDQRPVVQTIPGTLAAPAGSSFGSSFTRELAEFRAAIEGGPQPRVTAHDGRAALAVALAAVTSAQTGQAVELPVSSTPYEGSAPVAAEVASA